MDYYLLIAMTYANFVGILSWGADGVTDPKSGNMVAFTYTGGYFPSGYTQLPPPGSALLVDVWVVAGAAVGSKSCKGT